MKNSCENEKNYELKPFWGIPVKVWVPLLWAGTLILLLCCLLPLLFSPQSTLTLYSEPSGTPVFWKNEFVGHTPLKMKITRSRKGEGLLALERSGFLRLEENLTLSSWSFPFSFLGDKKLSFSLVNKLTDKELLTQHLKELSAWASLGEPTASRPIPTLFSDFTLNFQSKRELSSSFLKQGLPLINSSFLWKDFWSAYHSLFGFSAQDPWKRWLELQERFNLPNQAIGAFYLNSSAEEKEELKKESDFQKILEGEGLSWHLILGKGKGDPSPLPTLPASLAGSFDLISAKSHQFNAEEPKLATVKEGNAKPSEVFVPAFYLSRRPISKAQLQRFLDANSYWRPEYKEALMEEGLVDENYLKSSKWETLKPEDPAVFVSFYLAQAYADWINETTLANTGLKAKLPSSFQWWNLPPQKVSDSTQQALGVWYWMRDPHLAHAHWYRSEESPFGVREDLPTWEGEIRCEPSEMLKLNVRTPASLPRHWSAPHLSFYLVIEKES